MSDEQHNCPFYGRNLVWFAGAYSPITLPDQLILWDSKGNQCALILGRFSPCQMEVQGLPVDWRACPIVKEVRP